MNPEPSPASLAGSDPAKSGCIAALVARLRRWLDTPSDLAGWSSRHWSEADDVS